MDTRQTSKASASGPRQAPRLCAARVPAEKAQVRGDQSCCGLRGGSAEDRRDRSVLAQVGVAPGRQNLCHLDRLARRTANIQRNVDRSLRGRNHAGAGSSRGDVIQVSERIVLDKLFAVEAQSFSALEHLARLGPHLLLRQSRDFLHQSSGSRNHSRSG